MVSQGTTIELRLSQKSGLSTGLELAEQEITHGKYKKYTGKTEGIVSSHEMGHKGSQLLENRVDCVNYAVSKTSLILQQTAVLSSNSGPTFNKPLLYSMIPQNF